MKLFIITFHNYIFDGYCGDSEERVEWREKLVRNSVRAFIFFSEDAAKSELKQIHKRGYLGAIILPVGVEK